ncbi:MAG: hypothetical protein AAFX44_18140 [Pseudomonadota bacterium]
MNGIANVKFEGYSATELLELPEEDFDAYVFCGEALVIDVGSANVLGQFSIDDGRLVLELAQIDGGGEGVLPAIGSLAQRVARARGLAEVRWLVHAVNCAEPNLKLRRMLIRRGFEVDYIEGVGEVHHKDVKVDDLGT